MVCSASLRGPTGPTDDAERDKPFDLETDVEWFVARLAECGVTVEGPLAATAPDEAPEESAAPMQIITDGITVRTLEQMAEGKFGDLVKAVVDVELGVMAADGEMHADEEALLLGEGSRLGDLWGINLYPARRGSPDFIEFDSIINIRPSQNNRSRSVDDPEVRRRIEDVVGRLVKP